MHRNVRRVAVVAAIALVAGMGGLALGDFAMSGSETGMNASAGVSDTVNEAIAGETAEAMRREPSAPSNYSCQGCDASAGGEPPMADDFQPFDSTPLPPYRPEPADLRPHDLPVIEADRTAPDAIRRRANGGEGPAAKSAPDVPVLAADRRETGSPDPD